MDGASYDMIKESLLLTGHFRDAVPLHLITAVMGGTIAVTLCAPVDVMKSRIQSSSQPGVVGPTLSPSTYWMDRLMPANL